MPIAITACLYPLLATGFAAKEWRRIEYWIRQCISCFSRRSCHRNQPEPKLSGPTTWVHYNTPAADTALEAIWVVSVFFSGWPILGVQKDPLHYPCKRKKQGELRVIKPPQLFMVLTLLDFTSRNATVGLFPRILLPVTCSRHNSGTYFEALWWLSFFSGCLEVLFLLVL